VSKHDDHYSFEEEFHAQDRKADRKDRKHAVSRDRSKFKKTDQDKLKKRALEASANTPLDEDNLRGRVLAITPEGIVVERDHISYLCSLKGVLKKESTRIKNLVAVGDFVQFTLKEKDSGVISFVEPRHSILSRSDPLSRHKEQLIAVNIDQVLITCSVVLPPIKPFLVDRYIIAAKKGNMQPIIVVNKIDLFDSPPDLVDGVFLKAEKETYLSFLQTYRDLDIPVYPVSVTTGEGIEALKLAMQGKMSVFSGQSGVGKSSLINTIMGLNLRTGGIVGKTWKGTHTTSTSHLIPLEGTGFCIDTPGIKSFGLWDLSAEEIQSYFTEFEPYINSCKYLNCSHLQEPECAVQKALAEGKISPLRFASYSALISGLSEENRPR
jgi:ribosome biogenesis GTPase